MTPNQKINKFLWLTFIPLSFLGFLDSSYLAAKYFAGTPVACSVLKGCEEVTGSQYSAIGGIPVALLGAIYYFAVFMIVFMALSKKMPLLQYNKGAEEYNSGKVLVFAAWMTIIGLLASLWFIYLQIFVIKAICIYCMFSALTSSLLFVSGMYLLKLKPMRRAV